MSRSGRPPKARSLAWLLRYALRRPGILGRRPTGYHFTAGDLHAIDEWKADERRRGRPAPDKAFLLDWLSHRYPDSQDVSRLALLYAARLSRARKLLAPTLKSPVRRLK